MRNVVPICDSGVKQTTLRGWNNSSVYYHHSIFLIYWLCFKSLFMEPLEADVPNYKVVVSNNKCLVFTWCSIRSFKGACYIFIHSIIRSVEIITSSNEQSHETLSANKHYLHYLLFWQLFHRSLITWFVTVQKLSIPVFQSPQRRLRIASLLFHHCISVFTVFSDSSSWTTL